MIRVTNHALERLDQRLHLKYALDKITGNYQDKETWLIDLAYRAVSQGRLFCKKRRKDHALVYSFQGFRFVFAPEDGSLILLTVYEDTFEYRKYRCKRSRRDYRIIENDFTEEY